MSVESNWPYEAASFVSFPQESRKVWPIAESTLSLGIRLYSPQGVGTSAGKPILSHRFVQNTYRDDKFDKLSSIKSMGDQEHEDTEYKGVDSPMNGGMPRAGRRNGSVTPLSRFAKTPSSFPSRQSQVSMTPMTPGIKKSNFNSYSEIEMAAFEKKAAIATSPTAF